MQFDDELDDVPHGPDPAVATQELLTKLGIQAINPDQTTIPRFALLPTRFVTFEDPFRAIFPILRYTSCDPKTGRYERDSPIEGEFEYLVLDRHGCQQLALLVSRQEGKSAHEVDLTMWRHSEQSVYQVSPVLAKTQAWKRDPRFAAKVEELAPQHEAELLRKVEVAAMPATVTSDLAEAGREFKPLTMEQARIDHDLLSQFQFSESENSRREQILSNLLFNWWRAFSDWLLGAKSCDADTEEALNNRLHSMAEQIGNWKRILASRKDGDLVTSLVAGADGRLRIGVLRPNGNVYYLTETGDVADVIPYELRLHYQPRHWYWSDPDATGLEAHWQVKFKHGSESFRYVFSRNWTGSDAPLELEDLE